jgi:hypothetical protein
MLHDDATYTFAELSPLIVDYSELGDDVAEALYFHYVTVLKKREEGNIECC